MVTSFNRGHGGQIVSLKDGIYYIIWGIYIYDVYFINNNREVCQDREVDIGVNILDLPAVYIT